MNVDWKGFAELLGLAAVVGGIIFLGLEIRQTGMAIQDNSHLSSIELSAKSSSNCLTPTSLQYTSRRW